MSTPPPSPEPVLTARALRCGAAAHTLWQGLDLQVQAGVTLVRGGEGRGKSSLLRMLAGELPVPASVLTLCGAHLQSQRDRYLQHVFWMDPRTTAWDEHTAQQFWAQQARSRPHWNAALALEGASALGLQAHWDKPLYMLSTGSKRKVWITAAAASGAALTLLDGPFDALDRASVRVITEWLHGAAAQRTRAWVLADYLAPAGVPLVDTIDLGE